MVSEEKLFVHNYPLLARRSQMHGNKIFTCRLACGFPFFCLLFFCFFLQRTENVHEAMAFLPLSVAFHFLVGVYWSLRLLEGKVTGSQTAIM